MSHFSFPVLAAIVCNSNGHLRVSLLLSQECHFKYKASNNFFFTMNQRKPMKYKCEVNHVLKGKIITYSCSMRTSRCYREQLLFPSYFPEQNLLMPIPTSTPGCATTGMWNCIFVAKSGGNNPELYLS